MRRKNSKQDIDVNDSYIMSIGLDPEDFKTPEKCLAAVKKDGMKLDFVPEAFKTQELCFAAVEQNGIALRYAPKKIRKNPELRKMYVKEYENIVLKMLDEKFKYPLVFNYPPSQFFDATTMIDAFYKEK